jgi:cold shock protein
MFNPTKGFGFITPEMGGEDIFVHVSGLKDEIKTGDIVVYQTEHGQKGLTAINVYLMR